MNSLLLPQKELDRFTGGQYLRTVRSGGTKRQFCGVISQVRPLELGSGYLVTTWMPFELEKEGDESVWVAKPPSMPPGFFLMYLREGIFQLNPDSKRLEYHSEADAVITIVVLALPGDIMVNPALLADDPLRS